MFNFYNSWVLTAYGYLLENSYACRKYSCKYVTTYKTTSNSRWQCKLLNEYLDNVVGLTFHSRANKAAFIFVQEHIVLTAIRRMI